MKTCANPGCGKQFEMRGPNQMMCSVSCHDEVQRLSRMNAYAQTPDADVEKAVRRCIEARLDGVSTKELRRRFGDHVYQRARAETGPVGARPRDWLGVPV